jgi:hypothetical protein
MKHHFGLQKKIPELTLFMGGKSPLGIDCSGFTQVVSGSTPNFLEIQKIILKVRGCFLVQVNLVI